MKQSSKFKFPAGFSSLAKTQRKSCNLGQANASILVPQSGLKDIRQGSWAGVLLQSGRIEIKALVLKDFSMAALTTTQEVVFVFITLLSFGGSEEYGISCSATQQSTSTSTKMKNCFVSFSL